SDRSSPPLAGWARRLRSEEIGMSPGGHLVTTVAACAASVVLTRNLPMADTVALAGGIAAGGFLIDVDHAIDYVFVEGQRDLRPSAFLNYYVEGRMRRTVLALHSYELFAVLIAAMLWLNCLPLTGYVLGALMHLTLDLMFNAELTPRSITAFYSFTYRAAHRFEAVALLGRTDLRPPSGFWATFFNGAQPTRSGPFVSRVYRSSRCPESPPKLRPGNACGSEPSTSSANRWPSIAWERSWPLWSRTRCTDSSRWWAEARSAGAPRASRWCSPS